MKNVCEWVHRLPFVIVFVCFWLTLSTQAFAELTWETRTAELKPTISDTQAVTEFNFENKSDHPIKILSVKPSCDCTTVKLDKTEYQPGEKGKITATFTIGQRHGIQNKTIVVTTNDPKETTVLLRMKIIIPDVVHISPLFVYWRSNEAKTPKAISIEAADGITFQALKVVSDNAGFKVELKAVEPGKDYTVLVTPPDSSAPAKAKIDLSTDSKIDRLKHFLLFARVMPAPTTNRTFPATQPSR